MSHRFFPLPFLTTPLYTPDPHPLSYFSRMTTASLKCSFFFKDRRAESDIFVVNKPGFLLEAQNSSKKRPFSTSSDSKAGTQWSGPELIIGSVGSDRVYGRPRGHATLHGVKGRTYGMVRVYVKWGTTKAERERLKAEAEVYQKMKAHGLYGSVIPIFYGLYQHKRRDEGDYLTISIFEDCTNTEKHYEINEASLDFR